MAKKEVNAIVAIANNYGIADIESASKLTMYATKDNATRDLVIDDKNCQLSAVMVQKAVSFRGKADKAIAIGLNFLYMQGVHNSTDYKSFSAFGQALTGYDADTVNALRAIGAIFFDAQGNPVADYVNGLAMAHLNQLKSFFGSAPTYHCGAKVDHDFLNALFALVPNISVSATRDLIKILKNGQLDAKYIDAVCNTEDPKDIKYFIKGSDIELPYYKPEKPAEDGKADGKKGDKDGKADGKADGKKGDKDGKTDGMAESTKDPIISLSDALHAVDSLTMADDVRKAWETLSADMMKFITDNFAKKN